MYGRNLGKNVIGTADKRALNLTATYWALNARRRISGYRYDTEWLLKYGPNEPVNCGHGQDRAAETSLREMLASWDLRKARSARTDSAVATLLWSSVSLEASSVRW
jgi:hypothetical protein